MEAVRFPPGEDNRMRRRESIWGINFSPCGKARSPKSRRIGQESPAFRRIGESGSRKKTYKVQMIKGNWQGQAGPLVTYQCGEAVVNGKDQMPEP